MHHDPSPPFSGLLPLNFFRHDTCSHFSRPVISNREYLWDKQNAQKSGKQDSLVFLILGSQNVDSKSQRGSSSPNIYMSNSRKCFIHCFMKEIFTEDLLCAKHHSRCLVHISDRHMKIVALQSLYSRGDPFIYGL